MKSKTRILISSFEKREDGLKAIEALRSAHFTERCVALINPPDLHLTWITVNRFSRLKTVGLLEGFLVGAVATWLAVGGEAGYADTNLISDVQLAIMVGALVGAFGGLLVGWVSEVYSRLKFNEYVEFVRKGGVFVRLKASSDARYEIALDILEMNGGVDVASMPDLLRDSLVGLSDAENGFVAV